MAKIGDFVSTNTRASLQEMFGDVAKVEKQEPRIIFSTHALERCDRREFSLEDVKRAIRQLPKFSGQLRWDTGRFKLVVNKQEDGTIIVVTLIPSTLRSKTFRAGRRVRKAK